MRFGSVFAVAVLASVSLAVHAERFNFSFGTASSTFSGSGVLTTGTLQAPGEYLITSVTGSSTTGPNGAAVAISSLLAPGSFPTLANGGSFPANDNVLFVTSGVGIFSQDGLSFLLGDGAQINLYNDGPGLNAYLFRADGTTALEDAPTTITAVAATPEPASAVLLGTGLLLCVLAGTRRLFV